MRNTLTFMASALLIVACGGESHTGSDGGGTPGEDSGTSSGMDSGSGGGTDSGTPGTDSGSTTPGDDAGGTGTDSGGIPTRMGAVGSACASDADCTEPPGATCQTMVGSGRFTYEFPGGYCSAECTAGSGSSECGEGADCYSVGFGGFGFAFCAKMCRTDADCRVDEGYTCRPPPFGGGTTMYCLPPMEGGGGFDGGGFMIPDGGFPAP